MASRVWLRSILSGATVALSLAVPVLGAERITTHSAAEHVGERVTVCGVVASATYASSTRGEPTFLNLDEPYPRHIFTAFIWGSDRERLPEPPEDAYRNSRICITGIVKVYKGKAEVIVRSPSQIEVVR